MAVSDPATKQPQPKKNGTGSGNKPPRPFNMDFYSPTPPLETPTEKPRARVSDLVNIWPGNLQKAIKFQKESLMAAWTADDDEENGDPHTWFKTRTLYEPALVEIPSQLPTLRFYSDRALVLAKLVKHPGEKLYLKCPADVNVDGKVRKSRRHRGDPVITKSGAIVTISGEPMTADYMLREERFKMAEVTTLSGPNDLAGFMTPQRYLLELDARPETEETFESDDEDEAGGGDSDGNPAFPIAPPSTYQRSSLNRRRGRSTRERGGSMLTARVGHNRSTTDGHTAQTYSARIAELEKQLKDSQDIMQTLCATNDKLGASNDALRIQANNYREDLVVVREELATSKKGREVIYRLL
jgi:hypothetical protein